MHFQQIYVNNMSTNLNILFSIALTQAVGWNYFETIVKAIAAARIYE
jgi:hypothetical protein